MLYGVLVDLVPHSKESRELEHRWANNESSFWASGGEWRFVTRAQIEAHRARRAEEREQDRLGVSFEMRTKDGKPIGSIGINWLHPVHRLAMLGAKIGEPEYWGGGYGTDALLLIIEYAFDWLDVRKVWLATTSMNARVMRQMEKVGFTLEGRQRQGTLADGVWHDWLAYGLLRDEWPGREALVERLRLHERAQAIYADPERGR
ncbi:MAG: GNAT family N-acetyltransferase [Aggregatilineaceae bacterium]